MYTKARNPLKSCKEKDLKTLRKYVISELPALLHGIDYADCTCTLILHPILNTGNDSGSIQRKAMSDLIEHMRQQYNSEDALSCSMCHIFDIDVPLLLLTVDSSLSSLSELSQPCSISSAINDRGQQSIEQLLQPHDNITGFFWLILAFQVGKS